MTDKERIKDYIDRILKWSDSIKDENGKSFSYYPAEQQLAKVHEEVHELVQAILDNNEEEYQDAIGDIFVTLIVYAEKVMNAEGYSDENKKNVYDKFAKRIEREIEFCCGHEDMTSLDDILYQLSRLKHVTRPSTIVTIGHSLVNLVLSVSDYDALDCIDLAVNTIEQRLKDGRLYIEDGVVKKDA